MADIILVTHWTGGDVYPFIRLGQLLVNEGHQVTILTHCVYEARAVEAGLRFVAVDTEEEYENLNRDLVMLADPIGNREAYLRFHQQYHGKERLLREVDLIEKICTDESIIIARHRSSISGLIAAEKHHLRYASMILAPNYFSHMELHDQMFGDDFCKEINQARQALQLPAVSNWKAWLYSPCKILCGWPIWYAQKDETWPDCAEPIGFLKDPHMDDEAVFEPMINDLLSTAAERGRKTVIITGGSSRMVSRDFYRTAIEACELAEVSAIIVTPYQEYIPQNLPDTMIWAKYAPLRHLMKKVDLVIHHGGMGTINEAIDAAVPQIVMPHLTDGPDNADRLERLGIAAKFSPKMWDSARIAARIKEMLSDSTGLCCQKFKDMNGQTYTDQLWKKAIEQIEPYELPVQKEKQPQAEKKNPANRQMSREMLLKILQKKKEKEKQQ